RQVETDHAFVPWKSLGQAASPFGCRVTAWPSCSSHLTSRFVRRSGSNRSRKSPPNSRYVGPSRSRWYTITSSVWPRATTARFLPRRAATRRYCADRYVPFVWLAAHAAWIKTCLSHTLPFVVRPLRRLPALPLLPGHIPAQPA